MKLVVISSPDAIPGELGLIEHLFVNGLKYFHLRKPKSSPEQVRQILEAIPEEHLSKISLHQHHNLASEFGIQRLHFPEQLRSITDTKKMERMRERGILITTSIHDPSHLIRLPGLFEYVFLGPVFQSISKAGYGPKFPLPDFNTQEKGKNQVIGLGGIHKANAAVLEKNKFDGFALLGTIWEAGGSKGIENFKAMASMDFTNEY